MNIQNEPNPVIRTVKTMLNSPVFLVGVIGYSVYGLFEILSGISGATSITSMMNRIINSLDYGLDYGMYYSWVQSYLAAYRSTMVVMALLMAIPTILIATGMWLTFASSKNSRQSALSVTGLTIIRVIVIIQLVSVCLGIVLLEAVFIFLMVSINSLGAESSVGAVMGFIMFLVAAIAAVEIIYYIKLNKTITVMKDTVVSGRPDNRVSKYVEIFCYIAGGLSAISALTSLVGFSMYGFLGSAGLATANIAFAIFLTQYRNNMEMLMQNQVQPPQYQNPVQPQPSQNPVQSQRYQNPVQPQSYQNPAPPQSPQNPIPPQQSQDNGTTVLQYYNETSVLSGQFMSGGQMKLVRMTRQKTGETICISKPSFWIGKDAENVDYCITDNSAISRRHVLITLQNGGCFVRDNHSTNKVFVNGQVLQPDVDVSVSDGDRIRLGDEEFIVNIS